MLGTCSKSLLCSFVNRSGYRDSYKEEMEMKILIVVMVLVYGTMGMALREAVTYVYLSFLLVE